MDLKESSNFDGRGCLTLHDDELLYLSKNYLKEQDCLSLAMSGVSDNYTSLYTANRKRLAIGRNSYHLTPTSWAEFFKECITPESIITFDASHTYWLPPEVLLHSIMQMTHLEELCVHDTQISISHLPKIFENCPKLVKLTFTLQQKISNENDMEKAYLKQLKNGFAKLTQLKIFIFSPDDGNEHPIQIWLNLFQVLKWCRDCGHLVVKFAIPKKSNFTTTTIENEKLLDKMEAELFPHLIWMKNLKSLAILNDHSIFMGWSILTRLLGLLLPHHKYLERLWIPDGFDYEQLTPSQPFTKSLKCDNSYFDAIIACRDFEGERFSQLEHVADIPFQDCSHIPNLKHVLGYFEPGYFGAFNDFGRSVPRLERLHINESPYFSGDELIEGDWSLPLLKILKFFDHGIGKKVEEFIQEVIQRCPNIEEFFCLHIPIDCFSGMNFKHLKHLKIDLPDDESYLPTIFEQCPKLEILHLSGYGLLLPKIHFNQLSLCLPTAANLRDLRLRCKMGDDGDITLLVDFMKVLVKTVKNSNLKYFERFILDNDNNYYEYLPVNNQPAVNCAELEEFIVGFAKGMTHLVCLGFFGFRFHPSAAEEIHRRIAEEVVPLRPAFWYHLGRKLPNESDVSIPRVHYEEIVNPIIDRFSVPPDILNLK